MKPVIYAVLGFFLFGFYNVNWDPDKLLSLFLLLVSAQHAAAGMGYLLGALATDFNSLVLIVIVTLVPMFSLMPIFNPGTSLPIWLSWVP